MFDSLVSVVIPCFNHANELERAVRSALKQKYLHEIIIVDDCSTDSSFRVAEDLCALDPRIAVLSTPRNLGPAGARNFGVGYATGHYLAFLDADDEYTDIFLKASVEALESSADMQAVKTWVEFVGETGQGLLAPEDPRGEALVFSLSSNIVMTTEAYRKLGGFPEDPAFRTSHGGEDVAFNKALARFLEPLGKISDIGYRVHSQAGDHLSLFLENTVVHGREFSFVSLTPEQMPGGGLDRSIEAYLDAVKLRMG